MGIHRALKKPAAEALGGSEYSVTHGALVYDVVYLH